MHRNTKSKSNIVKTLKIFFTLFFSIIISCAMDISDNSYDYLAPPVITDAWQDGDNIIVEFIGYNDEYYFDGYNVYISTSNMSRDSVSSYKPVQIEGYTSSEPSYPVNPEDYDPEKVRTVTLYHYYWYVSDIKEYIPFPFSDGTYYIFLCSHHRFDNVLPEGVSNIITIEFEK